MPKNTSSSYSDILRVKSDENIPEQRVTTHRAGLYSPVKILNDSFFSISLDTKINFL